MGGRRAVLIGGLVVLGGCNTAPPDPLVRALQHTVEPGDRLGPAGQAEVDAVARVVGVEVGDDPTLMVAPGSFAPPANVLGWTRLWADDTRALWRLRTPVAAADVAVAVDDLPGRIDDVPEGSPVRGLVQHGPAAPGGELALTLFVQPPARMPSRPCVSLALEERRLPLGTLLDGRGGFVPGAGPRPVVRHRAWTPLPSDWPIGTYDVAVHLHTCDTQQDLSPPTPVSLTVARIGLPSVEQLLARSGTPDLRAQWAKPRGRRTGLRRAPDGSMEVVEAPPLPRMLRGEAWGVVVTPPMDPSGWSPPDGTVGPLSGLASLFEEGDASVVHWAAAADREGASPPDRPVRRVVPEVLRHLTEVDVDGVLLGADAWAVDGADGTQQHVRELGLAVAGLDVGADERAVSVSLLTLTDGPGLADEVRSYRDLLGPEVLLLGVIEGPVPDPQRTARALLRSGVDAGWVVADSLGAVMIRDGVPVLAGVPPMGSASPDSVAMRWYVAPEGVVRLDLVGLRQAGGRWGRDRDGAWAERFKELAARSGTEDVYVAVGQSVAAVDVRAHGPDRERPLSVPRELVRPAATGLPAPTLPERCRGLPSDATPVAVGPDLELLDVTLVQSEASPGQPVVVDLTWRARRALPAGQLQWYVAGVPGTWRASSVPCDGMWGFDHFQPGQLVSERVRLFVPEGVEAGEGMLQLGVRLGDSRPEIGDARFLEVGEVRVE